MVTVMNDRVRIIKENSNGSRNFIELEFTDVLKQLIKSTSDYEIQLDLLDVLDKIYRKGQS